MACSLEGLEGPPLVESPPDAATDSASVEEAAAPCTADLESDVHNCGACGHDCLGAACTQGTCDAAVFAAGEDAISALAVNDTTVAWTTTRHVRTCPSSGCGGGATDLTNPRDLSGGLALGPSVLVFGTGPLGASGAVRCQLPGCPVDLDVMYDLGRVGAVAVDGLEVFLLQAQDGRVRRCASTTGCGPSPDVLASAPATGPMVLGSQRVYWAAGPPTNAIYSCLRSGADASRVPLPPFAPSQANPRALAVDTHNVYWTNLDDGSVRACPLNGCEGSPRDIALGQASPLGIASDGERVFWANSEAGTVVTCPIAGCGGLPPAIVARGLDRPVAVALDAKFVYVVARTRTAVLRVAK